MAKVLHIQTSPRGGESMSIQLARAMLTRYRELHPIDEIETLDLAAADLPPFNVPASEAKYAVLGGAEANGEAAQAWQRIIAVIDHFKSADKLVISSPMWNFTIPYPLKHCFDVIVQPGLTFNYSEETGYTGLVTGRPALLLLARGGDYSEGSGAEAMDFQRPYLETILRFVGFEDIRVVTVEPTLMRGPETAEEKLRDAIAQVEALTESF
jgi:FMN-dependent NADH-azoreductase